MDEGMESLRKMDDADDTLVHRFVTEAMMAANVKLLPWIKKYCAYFNDTEADVDCKGETLQQYSCFKQWTKQLEAGLEHFWLREGFASAEGCFAEIERLVSSDKDRHQRAIAHLLAQLKNSPAFRDLIRGAASSPADDDDDDDDGDGGGGGGGGGDGQPNVVCFMFLPIALEDLVTMALQLGEYETFAMMMRAHAKQLRLERKARDSMRGFLLENGAKAEPKNDTAAARPPLELAPAKDAESKSGDAGAKRDVCDDAADADAKPAGRRVIEVKTSNNDQRIRGRDEGDGDRTARDDDDKADEPAERNKVSVTRGKNWAT